jgi:hypothetical protein
MLYVLLRILRDREERTVSLHLLTSQQEEEEEGLYRKLSILQEIKLKIYNITYQFWHLLTVREPFCSIWMYNKFYHKTLYTAEIETERDIKPNKIPKFNHKFLRGLIYSKQEEGISIGKIQHQHEAQSIAEQTIYWQSTFN